MNRTAQSTQAGVWPVSDPLTALLAPSEGTTPREDGSSSGAGAGSRRPPGLFSRAAHKLAKRLGLAAGPLSPTSDTRADEALLALPVVLKAAEAYYAAKSAGGSGSGTTSGKGSSSGREGSAGGFGGGNAHSDGNMTHGWQREGLYRVSGSQTGVRKLYDEVVAPMHTSAGAGAGAAATLSFPLEASEEDVAGAVKAALSRCLHPLFPPSMRDALLAVAALPDTPAKVSRLRQLMGHTAAMSRVRRAALHALATHLQAVAAHSSANRMRLQALATVFGPSCIRAAQETMATALQAPTANAVLQVLLEHADAVLPAEAAAAAAGGFQKISATVPPFALLHRAVDWLQHAQTQGVGGVPLEAYLHDDAGDGEGVESSMWRLPVDAVGERVVQLQRAAAGGTMPHWRSLTPADGPAVVQLLRAYLSALPQPLLPYAAQPILFAAIRGQTRASYTDSGGFFESPPAPARAAAPPQPAVQLQHILQQHVRGARYEALSALLLHLHAVMMQAAATSHTCSDDGGDGGSSVRDAASDLAAAFLFPLCQPMRVASTHGTAAATAASSRGSAAVFPASTHPAAPDTVAVAVALDSDASVGALAAAPGPRSPRPRSNTAAAARAALTYRCYIGQLVTVLAYLVQHAPEMFEAVSPDTVAAAATIESGAAEAATGTLPAAPAAAQPSGAETAGTAAAAAASAGGVHDVVLSDASGVGEAVEVEECREADTPLPLPAAAKAPAAAAAAPSPLTQPAIEVAKQRQLPPSAGAAAVAVPGQLAADVTTATAVRTALGDVADEAADEAAALVTAQYLVVDTALQQLQQRLAMSPPAVEIPDRLRVSSPAFDGVGVVATEAEGDGEGDGVGDPLDRHRLFTAPPSPAASEPAVERAGSRLRTDSALRAWESEDPVSAVKQAQIAAAQAAAQQREREGAGEGEGEGQHSSRPLPFRDVLARFNHNSHTAATSPGAGVGATTAADQRDIQRVRSRLSRVHVAVQHSRSDLEAGHSVRYSVATANELSAAASKSSGAVWAARRASHLSSSASRSASGLSGFGPAGPGSEAVAAEQSQKPITLPGTVSSM